MEELTITPVNTSIPVKQNGIFNNKTLIILPLFFLLNNTFRTSSINYSSFGDIFTRLPNMIKLEKLDEKIKVLKKVGPYLPETVVDTVNTIIVTLDTVNKVKGLMDVVTMSKVQRPITVVKELSNKERLNHIITTISEEMPGDKTKNIKPILDIALNFDKYKGLIDTVSSINSTANKPESENSQINQNNHPTQAKQDNKNAQLENMINAIKPMLGENADQGMDKIKDMMQMLEMLNVLNAPDKENSNK